MLNTKI